MEQFGLLCLFLGVAIIIFIVCRELLCWYLEDKPAYQQPSKTNRIIRKCNSANH